MELFCFYFLLFFLVCVLMPFPYPYISFNTNIRETKGKLCMWLLKVNLCEFSVFGIFGECWWWWWWYVSMLYSLVFGCWWCRYVVCVRSCFYHYHRHHHVLHFSCCFHFSNVLQIYIHLSYQQQSIHRFLHIFILHNDNDNDNKTKN